jgi:hypothetical protein
VIGGEEKREEITTKTKDTQGLLSLIEIENIVYLMVN